MQIILHLKQPKKGKIKPSRQSRIVQIPKTWGTLQLISIFAGLSALEDPSGGAAGIAHAVDDECLAKHQLEELQRHN